MQDGRGGDEGLATLHKTTVIVIFVENQLSWCPKASWFRTDPRDRIEDGGAEALHRSKCYLGLGTRQPVEAIWASRRKPWRCRRMHARAAEWLHRACTRDDNLLERERREEMDGPQGTTGWETLSSWTTLDATAHNNMRSDDTDCLLERAGQSMPSCRFAPECTTKIQPNR